MEFDLITSGATPIGVPAAAKPEGQPATEQKPNEQAKPEAAAKPEGQPQVDKPGRRAAAAKKAEQQASRKMASAAPVVQKAAKYEEAIASGDVDKIMSAFGLSDEKLVDMYIARHGAKEPGEGGKETPAELAALAKEFADFKAEIAAEKVKDKEKSADAAAKAQVQGHIDGLKAFASKPEHGDRFEICNAEPAAIRALTDGEYTSAAAIAFDVMVNVHRDKGEFVTYEQALDMTEAALLQAHQARQTGLGKLKKLGGAAAPAKTETKAPAAAAAGGGDGDIDAAATERLREAFKKARPRMTNALSVSHPITTTRPSSRAEADKRFRERLMAAAAGGQSN